MITDKEILVLHHSQYGCTLYGADNVPEFTNRQPITEIDKKCTWH